MLVVKGKHGGFCFGVKRAIDTALSLQDGKVYVLGEIIHNDKVVDDLKKSGVITINSIDEVSFEKGDKLIIRTHGEPKQTFDKAKDLKVEIIDCTCPFVKDIQNKVYNFYNKGYAIVIMGNPDHPEVKGINGWCENSAYIIDSAEEFNKISSEKLCVVAQTTYSEKKFDKTVKNFANTNAKTVDIFKTICYTTIERQKEADLLSKDCDAVIVLGGEKSNNTDKLYAICKNNCENTFRVCNPEDFDYDKIKNFYKVGIVLGASTPIEQFHRPHLFPIKWWDQMP